MVDTCENITVDISAGIVAEDGNIRRHAEGDEMPKLTPYPSCCMHKWAVTVSLLNGPNQAEMRTRKKHAKVNVRKLKIHVCY